MKTRDPKRRVLAGRILIVSAYSAIFLTVIQQQYSELSRGEVANNDVVRGGGKGSRESGDWEELQRMSVGVVGRKFSIM